MAKSIHRLGKLSSDRGINVGVIALERILEASKSRSEFVKNDPVVLHLRYEASRLKDALAVPMETQLVNCLFCSCLVGERRIGHQEVRTHPTQTIELLDGQGRSEPLIQEGQPADFAPCRNGIESLSLGHIDEPIVLSVKDRMNGGQCNVLVATAITADEVDAEEFIVVVASWGICANTAGRLARKHVDSGVEGVVGVRQFSSGI